MNAIGALSGASTPPALLPTPAAQSKDRDGDNDNNRPDVAASGSNPQLGGNVNIKA